MQDATWKGVPFTFILGAIAMVLTYLGMYQNILPPDVFTEVVWAVLGAYGFTSGARKIAGAIAIRKGSAPAEQPENVGVVK